jgi:chromatin assembly factor 1 subunit A
MTTEYDENFIVQSLKDLLHALRPKTLFRDLQYIAAFASSDNLDDPELGQAFLHMGLAALAWKDEVCRGMVDVADRIVASDSIKRNVSSAKKREPSVLKAMEYWIVGAREGNAIAQRELASLYLTHPDVPPIVSLPLTLSSDIFKSEMMWEEEGEFRRNSQALCLALHWMQEAAKNGDVVAQTKLKEREAGRSIR